MRAGLAGQLGAAATQVGRLDKPTAPTKKPPQQQSAISARGNFTCLDPDTVHRNFSDRLILASSGRVGSTMLMNELRHKGIQVVHTHNFAPGLRIWVCLVPSLSSKFELWVDVHKK